MACLLLSRLLCRQLSNYETRSVKLAMNYESSKSALFLSLCSDILYISVSFNKCTLCKSLWIKASAKSPKCKCKCNNTTPVLVLLCSCWCLLRRSCSWWTRSSTGTSTASPWRHPQKPTRCPQRPRRASWRGRCSCTEEAWRPSNGWSTERAVLTGL